MKTSVWTRDRNSSAEDTAAPLSRIRFASRAETRTSVSTWTLAAPARDAGRAVRGAVADELRVLARPEREALRRDVHRLEEVRLARAVRPRDEHEPGLELELEPFVRADVAE